MSTIDAIAEVLREYGVGDFDASLHGWRCAHPDRYGPCTCFAELLTAIEGVLGGHEDAEECTHEGVRRFRAGDGTFYRKCLDCGKNLGPA